mgnify:CR=1 FL=1
MNKKGLKLFSVITASGLVFGTAACTGFGKSGNNPIDASKTQLYVGNYDGGLGSIWLDAFTQYFEEKYAGISFEEGKLGVEIRPQNDRGYGGNTLQTTIANKQADVIFGEDIVYYNYTGGLTMDITDLVEGTWTWNVKDAEGNTVTLTSVYDDEGGETIYQKMNASERAYYDADGKFYGLPYYYGNVTITYNEDLFDDVGAFFKEGKSYRDFDENAGNWEEIFGYKDDSLSAGPDGTPGTSDDGMPATYEDFYLLCRYLHDQGSVNGKKIMPLVTCGTYDGYLLDFAETMLADAEGAEQFNLNLTGTGKATTLGTVDGNGNFIPDASATTIDSSNMVELQRQKGRYDVLRFSYELGHSDWFENASLSSSGYSNIVAQSLFINGNSNYVYAMLLDGNWWESEATAEFDKQGEDAKLDYNFKTLPIPKATESEVGKGRTYVSTQQSSILINNNIQNNEVRKNLAKLFVYEFHTNEQMAQFNSITGLLRPYAYTIGKETDFWKNMSTYAQSLYTLYTEDANTTLLFGQTKLSVSDLKYDLDDWTFVSRVGNNTYANPIKNFYQNGSLTAADYFKGLTAAQK